MLPFPNPLHHALEWFLAPHRLPCRGLGVTTAQTTLPSYIAPIYAVPTPTPMQGTLQNVHLVSPLALPPSIFCSRWVHFYYISYRIQEGLLGPLRSHAAPKPLCMAFPGLPAPPRSPAWGWASAGHTNRCNSSSHTRICSPSHRTFALHLLLEHQSGGPDAVYAAVVGRISALNHECIVI
jgi:hypothetical protein